MLINKKKIKILLFFLFVSINQSVFAAFTYTHGRYKGDGVAGGQAITGLGFQPDVVLGKSASSGAGWIASSSMTAGDVSDLGATSGGLITGVIKTLDADGFTVENSSRSNSNTVAYYYIAFTASAEIAVGSYTGNSGGTKAITGLGFQPELVWMFQDFTAWQNTGAMFLFSGRAETQFRDGSDPGGNFIQSFDADGFTANGRGAAGASTYHYVAFDSDGTNVKIGTYSGTEADQNVSMGFLPEFAMVVRATSGDKMIWKSNTMGGDSTLQLGAVSASTVAKITGFSGTGMDLEGSQTEVNDVASTHYYFSLGTSVLPVELGYFNAFGNDKEVDLYWLTYSEIRNDYFIIERSIDGLYFQEIGEVAGAGDSFEEIKYYFTDIQPPSVNRIYYRLRQVDFDGKETVHDIRSVYLSNVDFLSLQIIPNPTRGNGYIRFRTEMAGVYRTEITNTLGGIIFENAKLKEEGESENILLNQLNLVPGLYMVSVFIPSGESITKRLVIK